MSKLVNLAEWKQQKRIEKARETARRQLEILGLIKKNDEEETKS